MTIKWHTTPTIKHIPCSKIRLSQALNHYGIPYCSIKKRGIEPFNYCLLNCETPLPNVKGSYKWSRAERIRNTAQ
uniref:Uncharacterized protein n=1 Tax=Echinococcus canadensis TaxID=519352 RepID=A0A915EWY0_9CEST